MNVRLKSSKYLCIMGLLDLDDAVAHLNNRSIRARRDKTRIFNPPFFPIVTTWNESLNGKLMR